jgi:hypothetical protein
LEKKIPKALIKIYNLVVASGALLALVLTRRKRKQDPSEVTSLVFSFDRPLQLHALIKSLVLNQHVTRYVLVVYRSSSPTIALSYQHVFNSFRDQIHLTLIQEDNRGLKPALLNALNRIECSHYLLYVDDQVVFKPLNKSEAHAALTRADVFTYRLGLNTRYCYTLNKAQAIPAHQTQGDLIFWAIGQGENDFRYPFSFDGTFIPSLYLKLCCRFLSYKGPNSLEGAMNYSLWLALILRLRMAAPSHQKCVNFVLGRVQDEVANRSLDYDINTLHQLYLDGFELRASPELAETVVSPHCETGFEIVDQSTKYSAIASTQPFAQYSLP